MYLGGPVNGKGFFAPCLYVAFFNLIVIFIITVIDIISHGLLSSLVWGMEGRGKSRSEGIISESSSD